MKAEPKTLTVRNLSLFILVLLIAVLAVACAPNRTEGKDWPQPRKPGQEPPGPAPLEPPPADDSTTKASVPSVNVQPAEPPKTGSLGDTVVTGNTEPLKGRISDEEKQKIIEASLINLQRMIVGADEQLILTGGTEQSDAAKEQLVTKLGELEFNVIQSNEKLSFSPTEQEQEGWRRGNNCNLLFLLKGESKKQDKFGNFYSFEAKLQGKVLNLTTHQIIASKTITKRGRRALNEDEAAEDALRVAAKDMSTYLSDEVVRKWEFTSLVRMTLEVNNVESIGQADDIRVGLQKRLGVFYVSLDSWDHESEKAIYDVLCRFDVQRFLAAYVEELRDGGLKVRWIKKGGEAIKAKRKAGQ
ncbi:MAG TPA: hypothetical protein VM223_08485 [Planctomycetota bacterium]|nr:hypothetical protein [Planctomycetota bacterium]